MQRRTAHAHYGDGEICADGRCQFAAQRDRLPGQDILPALGRCHHQDAATEFYRAAGDVHSRQFGPDGYCCRAGKTHTARILTDLDDGAHPPALCRCDTDRMGLEL